METIGQRLIRLRQKTGLSQEQVANELNVQRATYAKWENDKNKPTRKLETLAKYFNVSTDYILGNATDKTNRCTAGSKNSTDILDFLFHDEPDFLAKIRSINIKGKINEPGMILKLTKRQKDRIKDIIRLTVDEAEKNGGHAKVVTRAKR